MEMIEHTPEDLLKDLANKEYQEVLEPEPKEEAKPRKKASAWGLKKKKDLNQEILKEIQKKLAESWRTWAQNTGASSLRM